MRRLTLQARLLVIVIAGVATTLAMAGLTIRSGVSGIIVTMPNAKMDAQIDAFTAARERLPAAAPEDAAFLVEFRDPRSGWGWRVVRSGVVAHGGAAFGPVAPAPNGPAEHDGVVSGIAQTPSGKPLIVRRLLRDGVLAQVAAPASITAGPLNTAWRSTLLSVATLALALVLAAWLQLRAALRPILALSREVADIRAGVLRTFSEDQPAELRPLAIEMNALIAQKEVGLANARKHVANLAHGLKTPLATLALRQARDGASAEACALVADLDRRIEHHLARARAAGAGASVRTDVPTVAKALVHAMRQLHRSSGLAIVIDGPTHATAAIDRQDLDEIVGNLLDNACRHARSIVRLTCRIDGPCVRIDVEDDGPGIAQDRIADALVTGVRLDESGRGYGFGLGICLELAELHRGSFRLDRSVDLGGLKAMLTIPR